MRFIARDKTQCLLLFPVPGGWEIRIAHNEGYETVHLSTEQAWQITELIHDCEAARKDAGAPRGSRAASAEEADRA